jgi:hypothetical protein
MGSGSVESKVKAGAASGAAVGIITYLLILAVPPFHNGVPDAVVAVIPFAVGWVAHVAAAYLAPHTPRTPVPGPADVPQRGGYSAGSQTVSDLPPPPPSVTVPSPDPPAPPAG